MREVASFCYSFFVKPRSFTCAQDLKEPDCQYESAIRVSHSRFWSVYLNELFKNVYVSSSSVGDKIGKNTTLTKYHIILYFKVIV